MFHSFLFPSADPSIAAGWVGQGRRLMYAFALMLAAGACSSSSPDTPSGADAAGSSGTTGSSGDTGGSGTGATSGSTGPRDSSSGPTCDAPGGPVAGPADSHCMVDGSPVVQETNDASCHPPHTDAATAADDDAGASDYGETIYGTEGDDDDCKYHLTFTVTPICENEDATFTIVVTKKSDGSPATSAGIYAEVYQPDTTNLALPPPAAEGPDGTYTLPIRFNASGRWVVRLHLYGTCEDLLEDSPHGHAAFYVDVP